MKILLLWGNIPRHDFFPNFAAHVPPVLATLVLIEYSAESVILRCAISLVGIGDMSAGVLAVHSAKHTSEAFCAAAISIAVGRVYHREVKRLIR